MNLIYFLGSKWAQNCSYSCVCYNCSTHTQAILTWRDSNISDWQFYCFSDEDSSEGATRSEITIEVLHWRYSTQYRWQLPTAFGGEDTLNLKMVVNRHAAWYGDQPPDLTIWLLVPSIQCNSNILRNATGTAEKLHAAGNLLHAELTAVVVPKASELSYHLFLFTWDYLIVVTDRSKYLNILTRLDLPPLQIKK